MRGAWPGIRSIEVAVTISAFDLFTIGIGPSSSHTVGPMKAAYRYTRRLEALGIAGDVARVRVQLFGSLGATGHGHGSVKAVILGLAGQQPQLVEPAEAQRVVDRVADEQVLALGGARDLRFIWSDDIVLHLKKSLDYHPNGMRFEAYDADGACLDRREYYSVGGGFVLDESEIGGPFLGAASAGDASPELPHPYDSGEELVARATETGLSISQLVLENELAQRSETEIRDGLLNIWAVMLDTIERGSTTGGILPGGLKVRRRAAEQRRQLEAALAGPQRDAVRADPLRAMEWVTLYALAVNEENAAGGRVVTAPTNGAAGIIPAVLNYYVNFVPGADEDGIVRFLLTATAIGTLFKRNASISGAEVGCQGEVGSACSMAAGALAEVLGGTPSQVENAAEIGIEHNLGLTCDPVGGLVQIPCIERNAVASIKAITAARMAVRGDGTHLVSLDMAIKTMRETGRDMSSKYKETSRGGLALNIVEC